MPPNTSPPPPSNELKKALAVVLQELMKNGNNFLEGAALADGRLFKVRIEIREVIE